MVIAFNYVWRIDFLHYFNFIFQNVFHPFYARSYLLSHSKIFYRIQIRAAGQFNNLIFISFKYYIVSLLVWALAPSYIKNFSHPLIHQYPEEFRPKFYSNTRYLHCHQRYIVLQVLMNLLHPKSSFVVIMQILIFFCMLSGVISNIV